MTDDKWIAERDDAAKVFCSDWPYQQYHPNDLTTFFEKGADFGYERGLADLEERVESANQTNHLKQMINQELQRHRAELKVELEAVKTGKGIANPYILKDELIKDLTAEVEHLREIVSYLPKVPSEPYEREMAKEIDRLKEALKDVIRNSHDIIAKKRCSEVLANLPEELK